MLVNFRVGEMYTVTVAGVGEKGNGNKFHRFRLLKLISNKGNARIYYMGFLGLDVELEIGNESVKCLIPEHHLTDHVSIIELKFQQLLMH